MDTPYNKIDLAMMLLLLVCACLAVANLLMRGEWAGKVVVYGEEDDRVYHVRDFEDWDEMLESIGIDDDASLADTEEE